MAYTGKAENLVATERGVEFDVVVKDNEDKEVLRRKQFISTASVEGIIVKDMIKNVVSKMTQEIFAHVEGGKTALAYKSEIESFCASCDTFVQVAARPSIMTGISEIPIVER